MLICPVTTAEVPPCEPVAGVEKHGQVLILGARETLPPQAVEEEARDRPARSRKARRKE